MQPLGYILIAIGVFVVFVAAPLLIIFWCIFSRKKNSTFASEGHVRAYHVPYADRLKASEDRIKTLPFHEVHMTARDGTVLAGLYLDGGYDKTAIMLHGYRADPKEPFFVYGERMYKAGYNLLLPWHRAHGKSGGKHTMLGLQEQYDVIDWIEWEDVHANISKILLVGLSMGSTTIEYASDKINNAKVGAMILDSGFSSPYEQLMCDFKKRHTPGAILMPAITMLVRILYHFDIRKTVYDSLKNTTIPAFFVHGDADESVSVEYGLRSYQSCTSDKELFVARGANHTMSFVTASENEWGNLFGFINKFII